MQEADVMAYREVIPNFRHGGHWFSKIRFGIAIFRGHTYALERANMRLVKNPSSEPDTTADKFSWDDLLPSYHYWKSRYMKQGYDEPRDLTDIARFDLMGGRK